MYAPAACSPPDTQEIPVRWIYIASTCGNAGKLKSLAGLLSFSSSRSMGLQRERLAGDRRGAIDELAEDFGVCVSVAETSLHISFSCTFPRPPFRAAWGRADGGDGKAFLTSRATLERWDTAEAARERGAPEGPFRAVLGQQTSPRGNVSLEASKKSVFLVFSESSVLNNQRCFVFPSCG